MAFLQADETRLSCTLSQRNMPANKTKNTARYSSKTKTAEEKIVNLCSFLVSEACGKILNSPKTEKSRFFSFQLCAQVCRFRFTDKRISASFLSAYAVSNSNVLPFLIFP